MVMGAIESSLRRGIENVGLITPGMLIPKVTEALESYRDEGRSEVTSEQIRRRMEQQHPTKGWLPVASGNLPGALWQMQERGLATRKETSREDETGRIKHRLTYSLVGKPQQPQTTRP